MQVLLGLLVFGLLFSTANCAICDRGLWAVEKDTVEVLAGEFEEFLSIGKTLALPLYNQWAEWRNAELARPISESTACKDHPFSPPCFTAAAGRTGLARPLEGPRVVVADYTLLRRDFEELADRQDEEIDRWLIDNSAVLSAEAAHALGYSREELDLLPLATAEGLFQTSRAAFTIIGDAGREAVVEVVQGYEVVGSGRGLCLIDALRDYTVEKLVETVFLHANVDAHTVGSYAVIDLGRTAVAPAVSEDSIAGQRDAKPYRTALLLRQVSRHAPTVGGQATLNRAIAIEKTLRQYGLSSADAWFGICNWLKSPLLPRLFPTHHLRNAEVEMAFLPVSLRGDLLSVETVKASESFDRLLTHWLVPIVRLISPSANSDEAAAAGRHDVEVPPQVDSEVWGWDCRDTQDVDEETISPFRLTIDRLSLAFGQLVAPLTDKKPSPLEYEDVLIQIRDKINELLLAVGQQFLAGDSRADTLEKIYQRCQLSSYRQRVPLSDLRFLSQEEWAKEKPTNDIHV